MFWVYHDGSNLVLCGENLYMLKGWGWWDGPGAERCWEQITEDLKPRRVLLDKQKQMCFLLEQGPRVACVWWIKRCLVGGGAEQELAAASPYVKPDGGSEPVGWDVPLQPSLPYRQGPPRTPSSQLAPVAHLSRRGGRTAKGRPGGGGGSALLPQSGDCWNTDRSICHPPAFTHLACCPQD
ncbi:unnamed protein product [Boreogadus saida]